MAVIAPVFTFTGAGEHSVSVSWGPFIAADTFTPIGPRWADYVDRSCQIVGTFNGATVIWKGSNDGTNYEPLTDPQGNAISKTVAGTTLEAITENTLYTTPSHSGGGGSESLTAILVMRRSRGGKEI